MRIRTIKPEFWANERIAALPEFTRLLAIALLNYADDEGYFAAHVALIRGSLFPFGDESGKIRGGLRELSELDYLRLGKAPDGREYGWIVHFCDHQKVEKPRPSRIKGLCEFPETSGKRRGNVGETSGEDQGSGNGLDQGSIPPAAPAEKVKPEKKERARDPLFDALAAVSGANPMEVVGRPAATCGVALAAIKKATPTVTPEEIRHRAANYRTHFKDAACTPSALSNQWAMCAHPKGYRPPEANLFSLALAKQQQREASK